jgi:RNA-directed DNA polymerase
MNTSVSTSLGIPSGRVVKNRKRNIMFVSFTPAVSQAAQKAMRFKIRKLKIRMRTELNIAQMAAWLNPMTHDP